MNYTPRQLLSFAKSYSQLGWSVQDQVDDIVQNGNWSEANPNAVRAALRGLSNNHPEIEEALESWLRHHENEDEDEGGGGRYASSNDTLRTNIIRLAAANPELRADLLPLLKEDADPASVDQNKPESYYGLPPRGVQAARRGDENRVVFVVGTSGEEGPLVVNVANRKKYPYDGTPEGLAATLEDAATSSIRFQSMDFLDGPELNVVKAPRVPPSLAQTVSMLVGRSNLRQPDYPSLQTPRPYVALRGTSMGLEWAILPRAPKFATTRRA